MVADTAVAGDNGGEEASLAFLEEKERGSAYLHKKRGQLGVSKCQG